MLLLPECLPPRLQLTIRQVVQEPLPKCVCAGEGHGEVSVRNRGGQCRARLCAVEFCKSACTSRPGSAPSGLGLFDSFHGTAGAELVSVASRLWTNFGASDFVRPLVALAAVPGPDRNHPGRHGRGDVWWRLDGVIGSRRACWRSCGTRYQAKMLKMLVTSCSEGWVSWM